MRGGTRPKSYWGDEIRERIAQQVPKIGHWRIIEGDYTLAPDIEATWFVDPPYSGAVGRRYRFSDVNFVDLGKWSRRRRGQVIVCENEGATWLPFAPLTSIRGTRTRYVSDHKLSAEAVWYGSTR